jgi:hypothetical protein
MGHIIESGTGNGAFAKVNDENQLEVKSFTNDLHSRAQQGLAFSGYLKRDIAVDNAEEALGVVTYNGAGRMVISEMTFSLSLTDLTATQIARIEVHVDPTSVSGGTARTPINLNRASNIVSDASMIAGDTAITATIGGVATEIFHTQLASNGTCTWAWSPQEAYLLEQGDSFIVTAKGRSSTATLPGVRCTLRWYEEDLDVV